jgi:hypothetical protein
MKIFLDGAAVSALPPLHLIDASESGKLNSVDGTGGGQENI